MGTENTPSASTPPKLLDIVRDNRMDQAQGCGTSRSLQILRASISLISRCLGMVVALRAADRGVSCHKGYVLADDVEPAQFFFGKGTIGFKN